MLAPIVQRAIDAGSKHSPEELQAAWERIQQAAREYLRKELRIA